MSSCKSCESWVQWEPPGSGQLQTHEEPKNRSSPECEDFHSLHQCMVSVFYGAFVCPESVHPLLSKIQHILLWAVLQCHYTSWEKLLFPLNIMNLLSLAFEFSELFYERRQKLVIFSNFFHAIWTADFIISVGTEWLEAANSVCSDMSAKMQWIGSRLSSLCLWINWF